MQRSSDVSERVKFRVYSGTRKQPFYVADSLVYQIFSAELFTRSIYSGLFEIGTIVGKIPFRFDPNFDNFWISPDGRKILLNKGGTEYFLLLYAEH